VVNYQNENIPVDTFFPDGIFVPVGIIVEPPWIPR
jgi:hypothetical protein